MKNAILSLTIFLFAISFTHAQTKKIALESHSGKKSEFAIDGDGNFGLAPPILSVDPEQAKMHHYADSILKADSMKMVIHNVWLQDSTKHADSLKKTKIEPAPKKQKGKKAIGINGAAYVGRPKRNLIVTNQ